MKKNAYWRYRDIIENLKAKCEKIVPVDLAEESVDEGEAIKYKHYVLEDGVHVYVGDERVLISDVEMNFDSLGKDIYICYDEFGVRCMAKGYEIISFPNLDVEPREGPVGELVPSVVCWQDGQLEIVRGRSKVAADMGENLDKFMNEAVKEDRENVYQRVKSINKKLTRYEREEKITDEDVLKWLNLELYAYRKHLENLKWMMRNAEKAEQETRRLAQSVLDAESDITGIEGEITTISEKNRVEDVQAVIYKE